MESNKGYDKPSIWDGDIFKIVIVLNNFYAWIGLNNNSKGVSLTWLEILKDTLMNPGGKPIEDLSFVEDPWLV